MKNLIKILPLLLLMATVQSCSDILNNAQPSTATTPNKALHSASGIKALRAGMYNEFDTFNYTTRYMLGPSSLADGLYVRSGANRFSGLNTNANQAGMDNWNNSYHLINRANLLINHIPDGVISKGLKAQYRGEAYFVRAFAYHQLARTYGYEPGMTPSSGGGSGFKLGVPLETQPTLSSSQAVYHPRVNETKIYQQIVSDLKNSINLLSQQQSGNVFYPSKAAAEAELARVYLYWRKYSDSNKYAMQAIQDANAMGVKETTASQVPTMFDETKGKDPEGIWIYHITPSTMSLGVNNSLNVYTANQYVAQVPTQSIMNLYGKNDARLSWFSPCYSENGNKPEPGCLATSPYIDNGKKALELDKYNAEPGQYADDIPYLRVSELLLIESEDRLKGASGSALDPINKLRTHRGLAPLKKVTMQNILNSRRREFIGEGMRFFDLKRLGMDIKKAPQTGASDVPYFDHRVLDNIPNGEVANSKAHAPKDSVIVQNPGY